jgi:hypothetical protein
MRNRTILVLAVLILSPLAMLLLPSHTPHGVVMEVLDPGLQQFAPMWQKEIARRFPDAVGVLCHGGEFVAGQWIVSAKAYGRDLTAQDITRFEQARYPGRVIVLLCCNPGHLDLGISGVYFSLDSVWCVPDRSLTPDMFREARQKLGPSASQPADPGAEPQPDSDDLVAEKSRWDDDPGVAGNIYEFIKD